MSYAQCTTSLAEPAQQQGRRNLRNATHFNQAGPSATATTSPTAQPYVPQRATQLAAAHSAALTTLPTTKMVTSAALQVHPLTLLP